ncbi:MAG TPA: hypothetical protein PKZ32_16630 [Candidatus Melainabacteria bacterium]|nr:hypothetical protein [Candidatus Melainabacteria bacterium]
MSAIMEWIDAQTKFHGGQDCAKNYGDDQANCQSEREEREKHCFTDTDFDKSDEKYYKCMEKAHKKFKKCMKSKGYDFESVENIIKMHDQQRALEDDLKFDPNTQKIIDFKDK